MILIREVIMRLFDETLELVSATSCSRVNNWERKGKVGQKSSLVIKLLLPSLYHDLSIWCCGIIITDGLKFYQYY